MAGSAGSAVQRLWAALRAGGPETGWLDRLVTSALIVGLLATARPPAGWVWACWGVTVAGWVLFLAGDRRWRGTAQVGLGVAAVAAALTAGADDDTGLVLTFVVLAMFTALPSSPPGLSLTVVAAGTALITASELAMGAPVTRVGLYVGIAAFTTLTGLYRRQFHLRAVETAQLLELTRGAQAERARAAALDERTRIARELHDVLAHSLGALGVQLELATALLEDGDSDRALDRVRRARRLAADGLDEARAAVNALRTDALPLPEALAELAERHGRDHLGAHARVEVRGATRPVPAAVGVSLTGAAREALTNAARHAPGAPLRVVLEYRPDSVALTIANGPPPRPPVPRSGPPGAGLTGMRERLALVGGRLRAGADGQGWTVEAEVPV
ncbi:sensor histidine kinase [Pseudonocardia adelaidensis]|uniref:histidine kinase n=1 Tax=Pseudonocardia adelaidensis TaxID=648754 RepID=A0ABP9PD09_9PSEU